MTDMSLLTPAQIDNELAKLWSKIQDMDSGIHQLLRIKRQGGLTALQQARLDRYEGQRAELIEQTQPFNAEFTARGGWARYFLVQDQGGHVHNGMGCQTCRPTTRFSWLIDLAGKSQDEMVAEFGESACTVCFPSAPTNPLYRTPGRRNAEAQAAKAAEKAQRDAEKAAKAITSPDGSPLRVPGGYGVISTKIGARNALSQAVQDFCWYGPSHPSNFMQQIVVLKAALDHAGVETQPVIDRATKKARSEGAQHVGELV